MKFDCGPTLQERWTRRFNARRQWHPWFAWHPVRTGPRECRWLETLERKGEYHGGMRGSWWSYEYRTGPC
jgi:hypothetical protein